MRTFFSIIAIGFSVFCFGQAVPDSLARKFEALKAKSDSLDLKVISMRELEGYLKRIDYISQKQFDLTETKKYEQILNTIREIYSEADRKRKK